MSKSNTVEITSNLDLANCKELLEEYEIPVIQRGILFQDNLQWPDQYVITWKDELHFKIANWVYPIGVSVTGYYDEKESWEVEISNDPVGPVFRLQKRPWNLKNKLLIFLGLALVSAVLWMSKMVPRTYVGSGWAVLFVVFFFRTFIFEDETTFCVRFLERRLNPEKKPPQAIRRSRMSAIDEIMKLEESLRKAELGPDPKFFEQRLADNAVLDGQLMKAKIVEAHRTGSKAPKFTKVEMKDFQFTDHGTAVVVTCQGIYEGPQWSGSLKFMRVWLKKGDQWQIIAGSTLS